VLANARLEGVRNHTGELWHPADASRSTGGASSSKPRTPTH
jgi:hypothetical protein